MRALGFLEEFVNMTQFLFHGAKASVKVNGTQSTVFDIQKGVRQGYPLPPYIFLIVVEVLNGMVKNGME